MGYPSDILSTRAVIRPGKYVVIPPEGLVNNVIPGIEKSRVSIVASPKYGASFVQYLLEVEPDGGTSRPFGDEEGIEVFFYVIEGEGVLSAGGEEHAAAAGSFLYAPPGVGLCFANGLSPVAGKYGWPAGIVAGAMHYLLVTSVPNLHGGFCLYNGGFTAALVCILLVPQLESFARTREEKLKTKA